VLGGILLALGDWRWVFLINVPLCLVGIVAAWRVLPADPEATGPRPGLDALGFALLVPGITAVVYGFSQFSEAQSPALAWGALAVGALLVAGFVLWALRRGERALIDLTLLARRNIGSSTLMMFLLGVTLFGGMFLLPLYWQMERGQGVLAAALLLIPQGIGSLLTRLVIARVVERLGARTTTMASFLLVGVATLPFAFAGEHTSEVLLGATLLVRGLGLGALMVPIMANAFEQLEPEAVAQVSMQTRIMQQLGGALGTAVAAVILAALTTSVGLETAFRISFAVSVAGCVIAAVASLTMTSGTSRTPAHASAAA